MVHLLIHSFIQSISQNRDWKNSNLSFPQISYVRIYLPSVYFLCIYHMLFWLGLFFFFLHISLSLQLVSLYGPLGQRLTCAFILLPEHFTWQLALSQCPHLFRDAANNTSHWSSKGHYNLSKVVLLIITGEPSPRNISSSPIPTISRACSPQGGQLLFKAKWARSPGWKINVTQLPLRWILKRKSSGWKEQRLDLPVQAVVPGAYT